MLDIHVKVTGSLIKVLFVSVITLFVLFASCKKDPPQPPVNNNPRDTTYVSATIQNPDPKVVLVEEFTGIYCYTCPLAHYIVADIIKDNPSRIAAANIHSRHYGIYSNPNVMGNLYDFRTYDADSIVTFLGGVFSVPSGAVDRKIFTGETGIISKNRALWESYVDEQLTQQVPVNIKISDSYDTNSRKLQIVVELNYVLNVTENNYLTVELVENDIVDKQYVDTAVVDDYEHQHILRKILTEFEGDFINTTLEPGRVYIRVFEYVLPAEWNNDNLEVIAFVHEKDDKWNVLQSGFKSLQ
ncbi:MAG: Omp28-related outer membrane protein [Bacteroidetes bacterium]|nr:Omp28-related outer membrane protein [Bacteroidota bacterium]